MADEAPISTINNLFKPNEAARMPQEEGVLAVLPKSIARGGLHPVEGGGGGNSLRE